MHYVMYSTDSKGNEEAEKYLYGVYHSVQEAVNELLTEGCFNFDIEDADQSKEDLRALNYDDIQMNGGSLVLATLTDCDISIRLEEFPE